jgi:Na+/proline symporter
MPPAIVGATLAGGAAGSQSAAQARLPLVGHFITHKLYSQRHEIDGNLG